MMKNNLFFKKLKILFLILIFLIILFFILIKFSENQSKCACKENGFFVEQNFGINGILGQKIRDSKILVFHKDNNFNKLIDSTTIELVDDENTENQTFLLKETKVGLSLNFIAKFKKPITTNADWMLILNNNEKIKITEIENEIVSRSVLFRKLNYCYVKSLKINGIKNDTLISGLIE